MDNKTLTPAEITDFSINSAINKSKSSISKLAILGFLAGAFIAFAAEGSNMAAFNLLADPNTYGLGKALAGSIFGTGLMLVVLAGGELFTGNTTMLNAVLDKKITIASMLKNWGVVYLANFAGSIFIAYMMSQSGLFGSGAGMLGAVTLKIAVYKVHLGFGQAFYLGIMCNWLVCLAVWMSYGSTSMIGKIFAIFFPIWLFITSGFEHSVANMYYIPAGLLIKGNEKFANLLGISSDALSDLTWKSFFLNNLLPVTLGNIVGGSILVGMAYWYSYKKAK
ncbi:MAG: formate/nitrite transporter family protein [Eubacteriales bacterium]